MIELMIDIQKFQEDCFDHVVHNDGLDDAFSKGLVDSLHEFTDGLTSHDLKVDPWEMNVKAFADVVIYIAAYADLFDIDMVDLARLRLQGML